MSIDLQTALDKDMAVIQEDGSAEYVENESQEAPEVVAEQEYTEVVSNEAGNAGVKEEPDGQQSLEEAFFQN